MFTGIIQSPMTLLQAVEGTAEEQMQVTRDRPTSRRGALKVALGLGAAATGVAAFLHTGPGTAEAATAIFSSNIAGTPPSPPPDRTVRTRSTLAVTQEPPSLRPTLARRRSSARSATPATASMPRASPASALLGLAARASASPDRVTAAMRCGAIASVATVSWPTAGAALE